MSIQKLSLLLLCCLLFAGCGPTEPDGAKTLVVYSGRKSQLVAEVIKQFEQESGITVNVSYKGTGLLATTIQEEGDKSPADVFWAQDANSLGVLANAGFFEKLPEKIVKKVPENFCNANGLWVPTSGRARVLAYSPERVEKDELPQSIFDLTDPKWKGRIGWAPTNASFQAFVTAMRVKYGEDKTKEWLTGIKNNEPKVYPKNTPIIEALAAGEIDVGLPNHYYLLRFLSKDANYPVKQQFFAKSDIGNLLFVAGIGVLKTSKNREAAHRFIEFMLDKKAQQYFTEQVFEYPMNAEVAPHASLVPLSELQELAPDVALEELQDLEGTLRLLREVGLL